MDYPTIIILTLAAMGVIGLAWLGGYQVGVSTASSVERELADRRMRGLLDSLNKRKPRTARRKVK